MPATNSPRPAHLQPYFAVEQVELLVFITIPTSVRLDVEPLITAPSANGCQFAFRPPVRFMRILHIVPSYLPAVRYGGPIFAIHGLCKALAARGHEVQVFTTNIDGPGNSPVPIGISVNLESVRVRYFPCPLLRRLYWSPALGRAVESEVGKFD